MDYDLFKSSPTGKLVPTIHDQLAYVPNDLAPEIDLAAIFNIYGAASRGIASLNSKITQLGNPNLILRPLQRHEALTSSAMEGTYTTSDELALLEDLLGLTRAADCAGAERDPERGNCITAPGGAAARYFDVSVGSTRLLPHLNGPVHRSASSRHI